ASALHGEQLLSPRGRADRPLYLPAGAGIPLFPGSSANERGHGPNLAEQWTKRQMEIRTVGGLHPPPRSAHESTRDGVRLKDKRKETTVYDRIKPVMLLGLAAVIAAGTGVFAQGGRQLDAQRIAHASGLDAQSIADASGTKATTKGGVVRIEWPRDDVAVKVDGMPLKPFAGLGSWAAFTPAPHGATVMRYTVGFQD